MTKLSVNEFLTFARRSRLLSEDRLQAALDDLQERLGGDLPTDAGVLARYLVKSGVFTQWQCGKLLDRKYKGFFLGKYKLLGHLGSGGMSSVYLAEHLFMFRRAAVKVLPRHLVGDSSHLERFYREARAAATLDHPNIVRAYDIDCDRDVHFLVMEFVDGRDLQEIVRNSDSALDCELIAHYISQTATGLQHAHSAGLIHRDIKPANLLVDHQHHLKILDMGLARFDDSEQASLTVTHEEKLMGTADYLSPEQAMNSHDVDSRTDVYSLGCTMYFTLAGHAPFPEGTIAQRIAQHLSAEPKDIRSQRVNCPESLATICQSMMHKRPEERPQSAGEIAESLQRWLADRGSRWNGLADVHGKIHRGPRTAPEANSKNSPATPTDAERAGADEGIGASPEKNDVSLPRIVTEPSSRITRAKSRRKETSRRESTESGENSDIVDSKTELNETVEPAGKSDVLPGWEQQQTSLLAERRERERRVKKPPLILWFFIGFLTLVAIGLLAYQTL